MSDFHQVIDFLFSIFSALWSLIRSNLVLSFSFMVIILASVVSLLQAVKGDK